MMNGKSDLFFSKIPFIENGTLLALTFSLGDDDSTFVSDSKKNLRGFIVDFLPKLTNYRYTGEQVKRIADFLQHYTQHGQFMHATWNLD